MSEFFPEVSSIKYEGTESKNPLAFKHYNADELVEGKSMREHFRFGAAYWHCMRNPLGDPFGPGTAQMPWDDGSDSVENAQKRTHVFFEFLEKTGIDYYCFHDRDIAPELGTLAESNSALDAVVDELEGLQQQHRERNCFGVRRASSCTLAMQWAPRLLHAPRCSPTRLHRSRKQSRLLTDSVEKATRFGVAGKVTPP